MWFISSFVDSYGEILFVASLFTVSGTLLTLYLVYQHLSNYTRPELQKYVVRIILMAPYYSISSLISLRFPSLSPALNAFRDIYESYVLFNFFNMLMCFLGGSTELIHLLAVKPTMKHLFPFNKCLPSYRPSYRWLRTVRQCILQYTLIMPFTAIASLLLSFAGLYNDGQIDFTKGYVYIQAIRFTSVSFSLYALILFYLCCEEELQPLKPLSKFICVKSVIFLTFWQSLFITLLVKLGLIHSVKEFDADRLATSLQDFIVCLEMFLITIAHLWAFQEHTLPHAYAFGHAVGATSSTSSSSSSKTKLIDNRNNVINNSNNNNNNNNNNDFITGDKLVNTLILDDDDVVDDYEAVGRREIANDDDDDGGGDGNNHIDNNSIGSKKKRITMHTVAVVQRFTEVHNVKDLINEFYEMFIQSKVDKENEMVRLSNFQAAAPTDINDNDEDDEILFSV